MPRSNRTTLLLAMLALVIGGPLRAQDELAERIPADSLLYLSLPDIPTSWIEAEKTALWKIFHEGEEQTARRWAEDPLVFQEGVSILRTLYGSLAGVELKRLAAAITHLDRRTSSEGLGLVIDLQIGNETSWDRLPKSLGLGDGEQAPSFGQLLVSGEQLTTIDIGSRRIYRWDISPQRAVWSTSRRSMEAVLDEERTSSLAESDAFQRALELTTSAGDEARLFLSSRLMGPFLMMPTEDLEQWTSLWLPGWAALGLRLDGEVIRTALLLGGATDDRELFDLAPAKPISVDALSAVPHDAVVAGAWSFEVDEVLGLLGDQMELVQPGSRGRIEERVEGIRKTAGVHLGTDLLDQLSGELVYYSRRVRAPIPSLIMSFGLRDAGHVETVLKKLAERASGAVSIRASSHGNGRFHTLALRPLARSFPDLSYGVAGDRLWIAFDEQEMEAAMSHAMADEPATLLESEAFRAARSRMDLPGELGSIHYVGQAIHAEWVAGLYQASQLLEVDPLAAAERMPRPEIFARNVFPSISYTIGHRDGWLLKGAGPNGYECLLPAAGSLGAMVAVGQVLDQLARDPITAAKHMILVLDKAVKIYALDHTSRKPRSLDELVEPNDISETGYLDTETIPLDPWGNPFQYLPPSTPTGDDFDIISYGADGVEGGSGPNEDIKLSDIKNPR